MRQATEAEYAQAYSRAYEHERASTKRTYSVWSKDRGTPVCEMHQILTRGKVTSTTYMVNPAYLNQRKERAP